MINPSIPLPLQYEEPILFTTYSRYCIVKTAMGWGGCRVSRGSKPRTLELDYEVAAQELRLSSIIRKPAIYYRRILW